MPKPTFEEIEAVLQSDTYEGYCTNCGEWTHDACEPDAHEYKCPQCGEYACYGAEELLMREEYT